MFQATKKAYIGSHGRGMIWRVYISGFEIGRKHALIIVGRLEERAEVWKAFEFPI